MSPRIKAHLALLGTNLFFACNYSTIKYFTANNYAGPFGINIIRLGVCVVLFWTLFLFKPTKNRISKSDLLSLIGCAFTAVVLNQLLFMKGLSYTLPIHASLLTLITPILIIILAARILKERLTNSKILGVILGVSGALILIGSREIGAPGDNLPLGDLLIILSSVAYTFYFIMVKPLMEKNTPIIVVRWIFTFGFFMTLPLSYGEFTSISWGIFTLQDWMLLFLVVIPGTFLAYVFNVYGIKILDASTAGAYMYSQPVFAVIIAMIFLKEEFTLTKIAAAALIFAGVYLTNRKILPK